MKDLVCQVRRGPDEGPGYLECRWDAEAAAFQESMEFKEVDGTCAGFFIFIGVKSSKKLYCSVTVEGRENLKAMNLDVGTTNGNSGHIIDVP